MNPSFRVKNWSTFQHYHTRRQPWIKLHRGLLDDPEYAKLSPASAKMLTLLWLIASESEDGTLPPPPSLAWRLHISECELAKVMLSLVHYIQPLTNGASMMLAPCKQSARLDRGREETETETETETEYVDLGFATFWECYPKKVGKKDAMRAWTKAKDRPAIAQITAAIAIQRQSDQWKKEAGQFIPNPATWINQGRWDDQPTTPDRTTESAAAYKTRGLSEIKTVILTSLKTWITDGKWDDGFDFVKARIAAISQHGPAAGTLFDAAFAEIGGKGADKP